MNKNEAHKQADDLIGMNFQVPEDLTAPLQMKVSNELAKRLRQSTKAGKIFWAGAVAIIIINAIGLGLHFFGGMEISDTTAAGGINEMANYYYADQLNSY